MAGTAGVMFLVGRESPFLPATDMIDDPPPSPSSIGPARYPGVRDQLSRPVTPTATAPTNNRIHTVTECNMGRSHDRSHNNSGGNGYTPAHHTYGTQSYPSPNIHGVQNGANGGVIIPGSARDHNNNSDRSPLLSYTGRRDRNAEESPHAIFLRICHSPWSGINQTALTWIRGLIALYMVVAAIFIGVWWFKEGARNDCDKGGNGKDGGDKGGKGGSGGEGDKGGKDGGHKGKKNETEVMVAHVARGVLTYVGHMIIETGGKKNETHGGDGKGDDSCGREEGYLGGQGWIGLWKFETLSYFIQTVYFVLAFSWCLMHLVSPRHSTNSNPSFGEWLKKKLSHPTGECAVWFSIFYTAAISFPHVVVLVWWSIVVPVRHIDVDDLFSHGDLQSFAILNLYFISSVLAIIEVFFLSSVKRPGPSYTHILALTVSACLYYAWAYLGYAVTGRFVYWFLDYTREDGWWEMVFISLLAFISLLNIFYAVVYGLSGLRESIIDPEGGHGYVRLQQ